MNQRHHPVSFTAFFERLTSVTPLENQSQLAEKLQVGRAAISLAKQKDSIPGKWIFTLAEAYALNSDWLATGKGSPYALTEATHQECVFVPHILPHLSKDNELQFDEDFAPRLHFHHDWLSQHGNPHTMISLAMTGPCMLPEIKEQDLLLINRSNTTLFSGGIFAFALEGLILVRRIEKSPRTLFMICDNPGYPDISLDKQDMEQVLCLGQVIWTGREY